MAITMTDFAIQKVSDIMMKRQSPNHYLKISLKSGGCSGFMYSYDFIDSPEEKDKIFMSDEIIIYIRIL